MERDTVNLNGSSGDAENRLVSAAWAQFEDMTACGRIAPSTARGHFSIPGYRVLGEIHRGGQGVVYQAIQESTQRKIAIKVLKEGPFAGPTELARFDREIDVLSRLNHPHIVAIHDRGLTAGNAYYVMDYVAGNPLDAHVAGADLSVKELLTLFVKICDAVNVAHLRGVIHRDLKPGNIRIDMEGEPRILDFGLAKLSQEASTDSAPLEMTLTGQFVGSLPWASPEQAEGRSELLDVRTDVYSLGVILYQLLTGRFPYPVSGQIHDVVRHITQTSPARVSTLERPIDHDLELILLKCLTKEPERRYQSAGELARDIRHYLADEPVSATSPSAGYRLRKFVRRNRVLVFAIGAVAAALLIATVVSVTFGISESRQRKEAETALRRAERAESEAQARADQLKQVSDFQARMLDQLDPTTAGTELMEDIRGRFEQAMIKNHVSDAERTLRADTLREELSHVNATDTAVRMIDRTILRPAVAAIDREFKDQPVVNAQLRQTLASRYRELGLYDAAMPLQKAALEMRLRVLGDDRPDTLTSVNEMGFLLWAQGKPAEAEPYFHEALEKRRRVLGEEDLGTLQSINNMGVLLQAQGKPADAEPYFRESMEKRRRVLGEEQPETLISINNMGYLLQLQGKFTDAEPYYREALEKRRRVLGQDHRDTLTSINNLGSVLRDQGRLAEAEPYVQEALEKTRRLRGEEHPDTLRAISQMGSLLQSQGRLADAEVYFGEVLKKARRVLGEEHPNTLLCLNNMGHLLQLQGKLSEAEPYYREALEKRRRALGEEHPDTLLMLSNMGMLLERQGRHAEAEEYLRIALEKQHRLLGEAHPHTLASISNLGVALHSQAKSAEAVSLLAPVEPVVRKVYTGGDKVRLARFLTAVGRARVGIDEFIVAQANLNEANAILGESEGATDRDRTVVMNGMIELFEAWHAAAPEEGFDAKAAEWRARKEKLQDTTPPTSSTIAE